MIRTHWHSVHTKQKQTNKRWFPEAPVLHCSDSRLEVENIFEIQQYKKKLASQRNCNINRTHFFNEKLICVYGSLVIEMYIHDTIFGKMGDTVHHFVTCWHHRHPPKLNRFNATSIRQI